MNIETVKDWCAYVRQWATEKGWESKVIEMGKFYEKLALMHSELSEALEEARKGKRIDEIYYVNKNTEKEKDWPDDVATDKPEGIPIELADTVIRIMDFCSANNIDLNEAIAIKMRYNYTRPYRHGNKLA